MLLVHHILMEHRTTWWNLFKSELVIRQFLFDVRIVLFLLYILMKKR